MVTHTEICLDSFEQVNVEEYTRIPESRREEASLRQRARLRGISRDLTLFNGHYLLWEESLNGRLDTRRQINLAFIDPKPVVRRQLARERLAAGVVAACLVFPAVAYGPLSLALILLCVSLIMMLSGYQRSCDRVIFMTRHGRVAVFELFCRAPSRAKAQAWIDMISERARHARQVLPSGRDALAAEVADHRRMAAEGWLSRPRYERARKRILAHFGRRRDGVVKGEAGERRAQSRTGATSHRNHGTVSAPFAHLAS